MSDHKSVAIIGAGMSGLSAAKSLCSRGVSVDLFEANEKVGGCCATTHIEGYTFNDGAIYIAMPEMLDHLFETLELDRKGLLPLHEISVPQSATLPDGAIVDIGCGTEVAVHSADSVAKVESLQAELTDFIGKWGNTLDFFTEDILVHPLSLPHLLIKGWRHLLKLRGTAASHLQGSFSSEAVRAAFGGALLYAGAPPDKQPAAALLGLVSMLRDGYFLPQGGMGRIPEILSDAVLAQGGRIHLNKPVRRILLKGGRVRAIELENDEVVEVDAIVSTASAMHTYATLLSESDAPLRSLRKVRRSPLSHKGFILQLGLGNQIRARSHTHCAVPWLHEQSRIFKSDATGTRWLTYSVPTVTSPELAPDGCSIVEAFPAINQDLAPDDWSEARKADIVEKALEQLREDHELDIKVSRILSPKEFNHDTHLYAGAVYGIAPTAAPAALFRHRTPIRGLYLAGQTTWPGFGVAGAGMSGIFAVDTLMRHESF